MSRRVRWSRLGVSVAAVALAGLALPLAVGAHAELVTASPKDGDTVVGTPTEIHATYSENLNPDGSSLGLYDPSNARVARGGVVADGGPKEMFIRDLPSLAPGVYSVHSTTRSADDGDIERVEWSFTISPTPICTDGCNGQSTDAPPATPTSAASPTVSEAPSSSPSPTTPTSSGNDAILPVIAALAIVAIGGTLLLTRGRRTPPGA